MSSSQLKKSASDFNMKKRDNTKKSIVDSGTSLPHESPSQQSLDKCVGLSRSPSLIMNFPHGESEEVILRTPPRLVDRSFKKSNTSNKRRRLGAPSLLPRKTRHFDCEILQGQTGYIKTKNAPNNLISSIKGEESCENLSLFLLFTPKSEGQSNFPSCPPMFPTPFGEENIQTEVSNNSRLLLPFLM